jgi:hypothetical protein
MASRISCDYPETKMINDAMLRLFLTGSDPNESLPKML